MGISRIRVPAGYFSGNAFAGEIADVHDFDRINQTYAVSVFKDGKRHSLHMSKEAVNAVAAAERKAGKAAVKAAAADRQARIRASENSPEGKARRAAIAKGPEAHNKYLASLPQNQGVKIPVAPKGWENLPRPQREAIFMKMYGPQAAPAAAGGGAAAPRQNVSINQTVGAKAVAPKANTRAQPKAAAQVHMGPRGGKFVVTPSGQKDYSTPALKGGKAAKKGRR